MAMKSDTVELHRNKLEPCRRVSIDRQFRVKRYRRDSVRLGRVDQGSY